MLDPESHSQHLCKMVWRILSTVTWGSCRINHCLIKWLKGSYSWEPCFRGSLYSRAGLIHSKRASPPHHTHILSVSFPHPLSLSRSLPPFLPSSLPLLLPVLSLPFLPLNILLWQPKGTYSLQDSEQNSTKTCLEKRKRRCQQTVPGPACSFRSKIQK